MLKRRLQSAAITALVIIAGGVVQYFLAQAAEDERTNRYKEQVGRANSKLSAPYYSCHTTRLQTNITGMILQGASLQMVMQAAIVLRWPVILTVDRLRSISSSQAC